MILDFSSKHKDILNYLRTVPESNKLRMTLFFVISIFSEDIIRDIKSLDLQHKYDVEK